MRGDSPGLVNPTRALAPPVFHPHERPGYLAALHADSLPPDASELELLAQFIEYETSLYPEALQAEMRARGHPGRPGHNTIIFRKGDGWGDGHQGWYFSRASWGGNFLPALSERAYSLAEIISEVDSLWSPAQGPGGSWAAWRLDHPTPTAHPWRRRPSVDLAARWPLPWAARGAPLAPSAASLPPGRQLALPSQAGS